MEAYVDHIRDRPAKRARATKNDADEEDGFEHEGLQVPKSALKGCEASFTAADEERVKGSTQFFSSTALMSLLCRHDRVLFVANMHSAGEKQHYVLVLIETLFQHLPPTTRVGILYDIGCQLHRSCLKWHFLDRYMDRLVFAVSVFHAFGHLWACQLRYHPRLREGFGFTNGEGCERFWWSISFLIACLRVCGVSILTSVRGANSDFFLPVLSQALRPRHAN